MSEVNWVDHERVLELIFILDPEKTSQNYKLPPNFYFHVNIFIALMFLKCSPESYTVKIDHHPLGGVEDQ